MDRLKSAAATAYLRMQIAAKRGLMDILDRQRHLAGTFRAGPWIMRQRWHDLLFAHWPVPYEALRKAVPAELEIDIFNGQAWLGIVAFRLSGIKLRGLPEIGAVASFPEVNVRTYVSYLGRPGVYFMSLDADNPLAIALARPWFHLNYYNASIALEQTGSALAFKSRRIERHMPEARFDITYKPLGSTADATAGQLEHWLMNRFSYYAVLRHHVMRCDIEHGRWPLQNAVANFSENTMAQAQGIALPPAAPLLHYCRYMEAHVWPLRRASRRASNPTAILDLGLWIKERTIQNLISTPPQSKI